MSRILRRNPPRRRSTPFIYVDLTSDSEDDHPDERLAQLRKHLFEISGQLTSDEDESAESQTDEDSSADEDHRDERQYYTSDEGQDEEP